MNPVKLRLSLNRLLGSVPVATSLLFLTSCGASLRMAGLREAGEAATHPITGYGQIGSTLGRAYVTSAFRSPANYAATGVAMALRRPAELLNGNLPATALFGESPPSPPGSEGFEIWLSQNGVPEPEKGQLELLVDGREFFDSLNEDMSRAKESIDIQTFIFDNDDFAVDFADRLMERAKTLKVRVMYDDLGTALSSTVAPDSPAPEGFEAPTTIANKLKRSDGRLEMRRTLNPWLVADHTKLFQIDRRVAYLGGMNIGKEYRSEWHDMMVRVTGPVTQTLSNDFDARWRACRFPGRMPKFELPPTSIEDLKNRRSGIRVLRTDVVQNRFEVLQAAIAAIRASEERVWMETPYFSSDVIERELLAAARRGVDVRLVFPGTSDSRIMRMANAASALDIIGAGGKVYIYDGMTHLKALVCDDWAMVGSANYDTLSMSINRELNISTARPEFVRQLVNRVFRKDFRSSKPLDPDSVDEVMSRLAEAVADQL